ncbi:MAG: hypothetical protein OXB91_04705 [Bryobacterales bacterium]|nr:hypothetical protein [Bryobacterales bacterium]
MQRVVTALYGNTDYVQYYHRSFGEDNMATRWARCCSYRQH